MHFPKLRILWCPSPHATAQLFEELKVKVMPQILCNTLLFLYLQIESEEITGESKSTHCFNFAQSCLYKYIFVLPFNTEFLYNSEFLYSALSHQLASQSAQYFFPAKYAELCFEV